MKKLMFLFLVSVMFFVCGCGVSGTQAPSEQSGKKYNNGWYVRSDRLDENDVVELQNQKYNFVIMYNYMELDSVDLELVKNKIELLNSYGIGVIVGIPEVYIKENNMDAIDEFIMAVKDLPGIIGWYNMDEASLWGVSHEITDNVYNMVKEKDGRDVYMVFVPEFGEDGFDPGKTHQKLDGYANGYDVLMMDYYPCIEGEPEFTNMNVIVDMTEFMGEYEAGSGKKFVVVAQGFGTDEQGSFVNWRRDPTRAEYEFMVFFPLLNGADMVLSYEFSIANENLKQNTIFPVNSLTVDYIDRIKAGVASDSRVETGNGEIIYRFYSGEDGTCLITVNRTSVSQQAIIKIEAENFEETHIYSPYQVKIFEL